MMRKVLFTILVIISFTASVFLQNRILKGVKLDIPYIDSLYLPKGDIVKPLVLDYDMFAADFFWLRTIQAFGGHWTGDRVYANFDRMFDVIISLDPYFEEAYLFGTLVLGDEARDKERTYKLFNRGIANYLDNRLEKMKDALINEEPMMALKTVQKLIDEKYLPEMQVLDLPYKIPYYAGYMAYFNFSETESALTYYQIAIRCKDVPDWVFRHIPWLQERMGEYIIALDKWRRDYNQAVEDKDELIMSVADEKIKLTTNNYYLKLFRDDIKSFKEKYGRFPNKLEELAEKKYLPFIPPEPYETGYLYFPKTGVVIDKKNAERDMIVYLNYIKNKINAYKKQNNKYPDALNQILGKNEGIDEPYQNEWVYDNKTGKIYSTTVPYIVF